MFSRYYAKNALLEHCCIPIKHFFILGVILKYRMNALIGFTLYKSSFRTPNYCLY
ncbi:hypothetical protein AsAng_0053420 [Aureispira anguillae]|uniref:Uncharacterized protein n=1 Tax=Aureispira anguillae TaxID=2864201 RepID=A0A916DX05_9BACT|nr:hypothetical protein AsAng_0053420 [Aureispira anguillae]